MHCSCHSTHRGEGLKEVKTKMKSFDWTFTTAYHGTLTSDGRACIQVCHVLTTPTDVFTHMSHPHPQEEESDESIDYSKLKEQERIFFFDDVVLFEDELADNGTAVLRVKIVSSNTTPTYMTGCTRVMRY